MRIFDTETDGLLNELTTIHCLVVRDTVTKAVRRYNSQTPGSISKGLRKLQDYQAEGGKIVGHNVINFDIPAIKKVYPWFTVDESKVFDTLIWARLIYPDRKEQDSAMIKGGRMEGRYFNQHSLAAWGARLSCPKDDYSARCKEAGIDPWAAWSRDMEDYCVQDTATNLALLELLLRKDFALSAIALEMGTQFIICRQMRRGFAFDVERAAALYGKLSQRRTELEQELASIFPPVYIGLGEFTPKRPNKKMGYFAGVPFSKIELREFNPGSRDHISFRLKRKYGWEPEEFTDDGKAKIDETVLRAMPFVEAKVLEEYLLVTKRIGQVAEGKEAWLLHARGGAIYGSVVINGAVTGRMAHMKPNVGQTPANHSPYGEECRACWVARDGYMLVGADADALELRTLAGYMARFDNGAYIKTVLEGRKEDGTDMHSVNCRALGMDPKQKYFGDETGRDLAKTWFYAFIYGAGDEKLGTILTKVKGAAAIKRGKQSRASFMKGLPALKKLVDAVKQTVRERGFLYGLDGRELKVRSQHSALNTLLQSAGAIVMKMALVILDRDLQQMGLVPGDDYEFVANVHDEWQIEVRPQHAESVGKAASAAIRKAGEHFEFACPLAGDYKVGRNWAETH